MDNVERNILRSGFLRRGLGQNEVNNLTWYDFVAGAGGRAVDKHSSFFDCMLDFVTCSVLNMVGQKNVEAFFLLSGGNDYVEFIRHVKNSGARSGS